MMLEDLRHRHFFPPQMQPGQIDQQKISEKTTPRLDPEIVSEHHKGTVTDDDKDFRKRDIKRVAKMEKKNVKLSTADEKARRDEQQMINQNIIYAPQIIFMNKDQEGNYFRGEEHQQFYYYDPQRIEQSNQPIFKTEKNLENRPGYQQMLSEKIARQRESERQNGYEALPGQDKDYQQQYMLQV